MTGSTVAIFIFNALYVGLGLYIFYEIVTSILRVKESNQKVKPKVRKNPFGENLKDDLIEVQQQQLSRAMLVLSALLPMLILVPIYIHDPDAFYQILNAYLAEKGLQSVAIYIISFVLGVSFARLFLNPDSQDKDNEQPKNIGLIGKQLGYQEIFYLSFALCIILFSFLENDPKMIVIKVVTTLFLAGNAFYLVFRRNIKMPTNLLNLFKKDKANSETGKPNEPNEFNI
jgi:hypothetical protein